MTHRNNHLQTITGRYSYIGNPCETKPCLPGMAYAVQMKDQYYFITINNHWYSENRSWDDYLPDINDSVIITGYPQEHTDVFGNPFYTLEAVSLKPAK